MIHRAWIILIASFLTVFVSGSIRIGAYSILLPNMIQDLGINMTKAGVIRAAYFSAYNHFSPVMGWLTDRFGGRFVISCFCLFLGTGTFLMGRASSFSTAILFYGIVGIGAAAMWAPIVAIVQKWFGMKRRGLALGILSPSGAIGFGVMGLVLPAIVKTYTWRTAWSLLGISGWVLCILNAFFLRSDPKEMGILPWGETPKSVQQSYSRNPSLNCRDILKENNFWLIGISYLLIPVGSYIIMDFIVTYAVLELKIHYQVAAFFISISSLAGIAGGFVLMTLSDYIGRRKSLVIIHSLFALSILLIILARGNIQLLRVGIGLFGFVFVSMGPIYAACARDYFPEEVCGTVIGLLTIFYGTGAMVGPIVAGSLTDLTGTFRWSFGLAVLTSLAAALPIRFLREPRDFGKNRD
jgi:sugar phosphate permease